MRGLKTSNEGDSMEPKELAGAAVSSVAKHGEIMVKGVLGDIYDPAVAIAKEELKKLIPGQVDDMVIDLIVGTFGPELKKALLAQVDKISAEV